MIGLLTFVHSLPPWTLLISPVAYSFSSIPCLWLYPVPISVHYLTPLVIRPTGFQLCRSRTYTSAHYVLPPDSRVPLSCTKHVWYSEHGTYYQFKFILERAMSATHVAVILCTRTGPAYEEESMKTDYPDERNEYGMS